MRQLLLLTITIFMAVSLTACNQQNDSKGKKAKGNLVMVSSVSSDGKYAITTNMNEQAYLWDLENHSYKPLSKAPVNIYSAYFIKNSHNFIYQLNSTNDVIVQNTSGKIIKKFNPGFPSYGQVITKDLKNYFAADEDLNAYKLYLPTNTTTKIAIHWCFQDHDGENYKGTLPHHCTVFGAEGKSYNFTLVPQLNKLIGSANGALFIWNIDDGVGEQVKGLSPHTTNATSPDRKYVVVADQQERGFLYDLQQSKVITNEGNIRFFFDTQKDIEPVKKYFSKFEGNDINQVTALRFIDHDHFIVTYNGVPRPFTYLGLYKVGEYWKETFDTSFVFNAKLTKYLPLSKEILKSADDPYPETKSFVRDQAMDTSPSAHVLVMGQANGGGIMVYRYDPDTQELKLDWAPRLPAA